MSNELVITVTYAAPDKNSGAAIAFDPPGPWPVANGEQQAFKLTRSGDGFKFRAVTFWADVNQSVAQTFQGSDNASILAFPGGQILDIDTGSTSHISFVVKNTSEEAHPLEIGMEVTLDDAQTGIRYTSRDPQIELEGPGT